MNEYIDTHDKRCIECGQTALVLSDRICKQYFIVITKFQLDLDHTIPDTAAFESSIIRAYFIKGRMMCENNGEGSELHDKNHASILYEKILGRMRRSIYL